MSKLKLEVGKSYINGYGKIVAIVSKIEDAEYDPYVSNLGGRYGEDGCCDGLNNYYEFRLLREVSSAKVEDSSLNDTSVHIDSAYSDIEWWMQNVAM